MSSTYFSKRLQTKRPKPGPKPPLKPKAFKTEASAQEWAKKQKLKSFRVEPSNKSNTKFKIRRY